MNKYKGSEAGSAPIFIIILMVLAAGAVFVYQIRTEPYAVLQTVDQPVPTPTSTPKPTNSVASPAKITAYETTNWETYTNTKHGYTVRYPSGWQRDNFGLPDRIRFIEKSLNENNPNISIVGIIDVEVDQNSDYTNWTYDRYLKFLDTGGESEGKMIIEPQGVKKLGPTKIDGIDSYLAEWGCCGGRHHGAVIFHKGSIYYIYLSAGGDVMLEQDIEKYGSILNQVFSTFKFTQ